MEGASPAAFLNIPALLIVLGGTFGATFAGTTIEKMKLIPTLYKKAMGSEKPDMGAQLELLVGFAERARREGLLALDEEVAELDDEFTRKGLQLVVDGTDPELVREILENEIDGMMGRHHAAVSPFEKAGGFAPTMGIIGTVMGLVHVLENLDAPATLGPAISGAFIATLYGVGSANIVYLPVCYSLQMLSQKEVDERSLVLEGILAIQAGDNPRMVQQKLLSYLAPGEREAVEAGDGRAELKAVDGGAAQAA
jgi:chemotaxis protein MotA